uniref:Uncharacterized protein n=1 Tax=Candidatus Methanogaster sp. ANME-2c ERB4 TaxID=2759911 RepID=A0A7G9YE73_9EURY|nr:hypothetical protein PABHDKJJ_00011 [Methanosarcinales archaeon ANME-2c ERB4]
MNILGRMNVMWADILQVSIVSPFLGAESCEWRRKKEYLLTEDLDRHLDYEGHQKAVVSYPWLTYEVITAAVDVMGYYVSLNYVLLAARQVMRRPEVGGDVFGVCEAGVMK